MIFDRDVQKIGNWDDVVFNMDGRVPDEGACVEIGIAYALGKKCIELKTDARGAFGGANDSMVLEVLDFRVVGRLGRCWEMSGIDARPASKHLGSSI